MYKQNKAEKTSITTPRSYPGESLERKVARILNNKEPIKDGAQIIYSERKDGVRPEFNIKTDRFELAIDEMDAKSRSHRARREGQDGKKTIGEQAREGMSKEGETPVNTSDSQKG